MGSILKIKDENGNWVAVPALKGETITRVWIFEDGSISSPNGNVSPQDIIVDCLYGGADRYLFYYLWLEDEENGWYSTIILHPYGMSQEESGGYEGICFRGYYKDEKLIELRYVDDGTYGDKFKVTITPSTIGDIENVLDALHAYADAFVGGGE